MQSIESFNRLLLIVFLEFVSFDRFYAQSQGCYEVANQMVCYFQPNEKYIEMTWDDAWKVCKENNSTLPVIENRMMAETLRRYLGSQKSFPRHMWLAGREIRSNVWQWLNGKQFGRQNLFENADNLTKFYSTNAAIKGNLEYSLSNPKDRKYYVCRYNDSMLCQNKSSLPWGNGCLFIHSDEELSLVDARNRCLDKEGDLATFEEDEQLNILQKYSSLLFKDKLYWIGLRLNWWIWNKTDSSKEIKYSNWLKYEKLPNYECLYIRNYDFKWHQYDCTAKKPFLCQRGPTYVNVPNTLGGQSDIVVFLVAGVSILVLTILVVVVIAVVIIKKRKTRQQQNDATCVQTDGTYQDLHRGQDNMRCKDPYMELDAIAHQQTELNEDYQDLSDYDDVVVVPVPNYFDIVK